jgi:hypothetical protein
MNPRAPTHGEPTAETNALHIDSLSNKLSALEEDLEELDIVVRGLRDRLITVAGEDGEGGKLGSLLEKHDASAASQGKRLEDTSNKVAILMADRRLFQVLGAIAMLALGVLLKTLIDRASKPEPSGLLPQSNQKSFAYTELTSKQYRSDYAHEASSASVSPDLPGFPASISTVERQCPSCM